MRHTPDSISKKRQAIKRDMDLFVARSREVGRRLSFTPEVRAEIAQQIAFCDAEITKCRAALTKLSRGSRAQRLGGWGKG